MGCFCAEQMFLFYDANDTQRTHVPKSRALRVIRLFHLPFLGLLAHPNLGTST